MVVNLTAQHRQEEGGLFNIEISSVKNSQENQKLTFSIQKKIRIRDLKIIIQKHHSEHPPLSMQNLIFKKKILDENETIEKIFGRECQLGCLELVLLEEKKREQPYPLIGFLSSEGKVIFANEGCMRRFSSVMRVNPENCSFLPSTCYFSSSLTGMVFDKNFIKIKSFFDGILEKKIVKKVLEFVPIDRTNRIRTISSVILLILKIFSAFKLFAIFFMLQKSMSAFKKMLLIFGLTAFLMLRFNLISSNTPRRLILRGRNVSNFNRIPKIVKKFANICIALLFSLFPSVQILELYQQEQPPADHEQ